MLQKLEQRTKWIPAPFSFVYEVETICVGMFQAEPYKHIPIATI